MFRSISRASSFRAPIFYDNADTAYFINANDNSNLNTLSMAGLITGRSSGSTTIPKDLKLAILDQISYDYENRGLDGDSGICEKTWKACQRWTRISPIL